MVFGRKPLVKTIRRQYPARGVPVPASQALLNLITTVFGEPGTPYSFFSHVAGLAKKRGGVRVVVFKVFGDSTYMTALETRYFLSWGFRVRHHVVPACNDFLTINGDLLLDRAYSWANPVVIVDQYPTKMLWTRYEPVYRLMEKPLKYKSKSSVSAYLPGVTLVDAVYRAISKAEYPVMLAVCSEQDKKIQECTREGLLIVMDEYVSTLVYAVNMGVLIPEVREEVVKATVETPELEIKVVKVDKQ